MGEAVAGSYFLADKNAQGNVEPLFLTTALAPEMEPLLYVTDINAS
jgi:hypothetical protein